MSKYIKLYDAIMAMEEWFSEPITPTKILSDLPTIDLDEAVLLTKDAYSDLCLRASQVSEDCISREWVLDKIHAYAEKDTTSTGASVGADYCAEFVENAPSVVPKRSCYRCGLREDCEDSTERKPKQGEQSSMVGEWIDRCRENEDYECSECGGVTEKFGGQYLYDYCPFCGAKMCLE